MGILKSTIAIAVALGSAWSCKAYYVAPDDAGSDGATVPGDSGVPDASGLDDSPSSADVAAPASPCTSPAASVVFCDDFDTGALGAKWDDANAPLCSLDVNVAKSAPQSLHVVLPDTGSEQASHLTKGVPVPLSSNVRVAFELWIDVPGAAYPFGLWFHDYNLTWSPVDLKVTESIPQDSGTPTFAFHDAPGPVPQRTWVHVELEVDRKNGKATFHLGTQSSTFALAGAAFVALDDVPGLFMGLFDAGPHVSWDAHIDNVVVSTF